MLYAPLAPIAAAEPMARRAPIAPLASLPAAAGPAPRRQRSRFDIRPLEAGDDLQPAERLLQQYRTSVRQRFAEAFGPIFMSAGTFRWGDAQGELVPMYRPPDGLLLVAWDKQVPAGCVAVRHAAIDGHALIERLYVEPRFRRNGLGHELLRRASQGARDLGYRQLRFALPGLAIGPFAAHGGSILVDATG